MTVQERILDYREELDKIDNAILELLEKRMKVCKEIGSYKKENGLPICDLNRERQVIESRVKEFDLPTALVEDLYKIIFQASKELQRKNQK